MYIYGGYELHAGIKDDFICFDYSQTQLGVPEHVKTKNPENSPGKQTNKR